ncbi:translation elongation factor Ts [soil metagenome]
MTISAAQVKELREITGAGIMESKRALEEASGDLRKAEAILMQQGVAKAEKKAGRAAQQGIVEPYIHGGGRIAALVEVNCETDFVARTEDFKALAHDVAMQVAAMAPKYISAEDVPEADWSELEREFGDRKRAAEAVCLLDQAFIKDPKQSVRDLNKVAIGKLGENVIIRRFARFEVGADHPPLEETDSE